MRAVLHPRIATGPGRLQVFVGDFEAKAQRPLRFTLDGVAAEPLALRPFASVRGLAEGVAAGSTEARAFTGVYEFRDLVPGRRYRVGAHVGDEEKRLDVVPLPARVPSASEGGFDVLLASCFYRGECNDGALQRALRQVVQGARPKRSGRPGPDCSFLMGDQVYLDLPTLEDFPNDRRQLAQKFEENYRQNWEGVFSAVLGSAPSVCIPDDHEYWNNAPHWSPQNGNTWSADGIATWKAAARVNFEGFAKPFNDRGTDSLDDPLTFDVEPLSFFFADTRTGRDPERKHTLTRDGFQALKRWVTAVNDKNYVGVFVSGQSLVRAPAGSVKGKVADWEMPNYDDYRAILAELGRIRQRVLLLTGDVHWGRVSSATNRFTGFEHVQEVVVSPLSLVTTAGVDPLKRAANWMRGLVSKPDDWPRHRKGDEPPDELPFGPSPEQSYRMRTAKRSNSDPALIQGNQLGLLSFDWTGARLRADITYFPVHDRLTQPVRVPLFETAVASR